MQPKKVSNKVSGGDNSHSDTAIGGRKKLDEAASQLSRGESYEINMASSNHRGIQVGSAWFQRKINLRPQHRGVHLVTEEILRQMPELGQFSVGLCHVQSK